MPVTLIKVPYSHLNSRQRESHNYQKVSAALADFGYATIRLHDDWSGADFIAQHQSGSFLKIQLKSRPVLATKYIAKDLYIAFPSTGAWYLYEHDVLLSHLRGLGQVVSTQSWTVHGSYSWPGSISTLLSTGLLQRL